MQSINFRSFAIVIAAAAASANVFAGRPLVVDDANVNEPGRGHVETWVSHAPGSSIVNVAPAYAPVQGLELGALLARDRDARTTLSALQAKWLITPSNESGCNLGLVGGIGHESGAGRSLYLNLLTTCNMPQAGSLHFNLGAIKPRGTSSTGSWGVAYERPVGSVTPHIEWFGSEGRKPTVQIGLRGDISEGVQLDGTLGRSDGHGVFTLGLKFTF